MVQWFRARVVMAAEADEEAEVEEDQGVYQIGQSF